MSLSKHQEFDIIDPEGTDPVDSDATEPFLHSDSNRESRHSSVFRSPAWVISTLVLLLVLLIQSLYVFAQPRRLKNSYEHGFDTELDFMKPAIKLHQKRFGSPIRDLPNGTLYTVFDPSEPRYIGSPSAEIDDAWNTLLQGRYILFSDDDVSWLDSDDGLPKLHSLPARGTAIPKTGYYGGPDMLHSLHCVNAIRQHLDFEYYKDHMWLPEEYQRMHIDHCLEQLRQSTLCHGDMTPVTLKAIWTDQPRWAALGQTERMHTCRDGMALREWTWKRGDKTGRITLGG
ncbi:hypothetical protein BGW36DRAFT_393878 [Talaromyces proteolyticus]|uniref:Uncharacterized protein n=1 Tax=Talaromyces proteolyticus TaxID=1131652 RepID=A0AAD4KXW6_9EURO|nr:uncharacterized protein BGW36DRAFT_393878 [Talaromyces proteolyticus]KAH8703586.1 hypothetical protein BGW36DRAFT_393878 [Talaromyces proteolyticus]